MSPVVREILYMSQYTIHWLSETSCVALYAGHRELLYWCWLGQPENAVLNLMAWFCLWLLACQGQNCAKILLK